MSTDAVSAPLEESLFFLNSSIIWSGWDTMQSTTRIVWVSGVFLPAPVWWTSKAKLLKNWTFQFPILSHTREPCIPVDFKGALYKWNRLFINQLKLKKYHQPITYRKKYDLPWIMISVTSEAIRQWKSVANPIHNHYSRQSIHIVFNTCCFMHGTHSPCENKHGWLILPLSPRTASFMPL